MALPARPVRSCATSTSALGARRKRCRLLRDSRSVAKTRCSSAASASRSPRSAGRTRTFGAGAWASVKDIVTGQGSTLISPSPRSATPRPGAVGHPVRAPPAPPKTRARQHNRRDNRRPQNSAVAAFEPVRRPPRPTEERNANRRPEQRPSALSLQQPHRFKHRCIAQPPLHRSTTAASPQPPLHRLNHRCTASTTAASPQPPLHHFNEGALPVLKKVAIGASAPIHPRVGQSGPPGFSSGRACFCRAGGSQ